MEKGEKDQAYRLWYDCSMHPYILEPDAISALCGMAIYQSEKGNRAITLVLVKEIKEKIILLSDEANIRFSVTLNSLGIALAKIKECQEAEEILRKAMDVNKSIFVRSEDDQETKEAILQRAKNAYNLSTLVLIPQGKKEEAFNLLSNECIPGYADVEAETDLAAAYYFMSTVCDPKETLKYLILSAELWYHHINDAPDRWNKAVENIRNEIRKMEGEENLDARVTKIIQEIQGKSNSEDD